MLLFSPTLASQISSLLRSLTTSNYQAVLNDLWKVVEYGIDGCVLLLQTCLEHVKVQDVDTQTMRLKLDAFSAVFRYLLDRPNFSTIFCLSVRTQVSESFLGDLSKSLHLSIPEKIGIGLALSDSDDVDVRLTGQSFCMIQIKELCANPSSIAYDEIQNVIMFLYQCESLSKHVDAFMATLSLMQMKEKTPFVLRPMLTDALIESVSLRGLDSFSETNDNEFDALLAEIQKEISVADIVKELGYECTLSGSHCKEILSLYSPLDEAALAKIISIVVRTHTGLEDSQNLYATFCAALGNSSVADSSRMISWNVDVLIDSIKQIVPETNWISVMGNLDHEGFYLPDEKSFLLLMSIYRNACQEPFPLHAVIGATWKNAEGQLSFLKFAISAPPEIFTFSHAARQLSYMDLPQGNKVPQITPNQAWISLDLFQVLCELAERGHASTVRTLLEYPLNHCPEILLVGVAQLNTAFNLIQYELFSTIFPIIVRNDPQNGCVRQLWLANHNLVVRGFLDMHSNDPDSASGILDICHELKILNSVLDMSPFSFSIKLAVLASKREYMDLEKWFNQNLSIFKDSFFEGCLKFLKERVLFDVAMDAQANPFQHLGGDSIVSQEILSTFFKTLQGHCGQLVSPQLFEEMNKLLAATVQANPRLQSVVVTDSSASQAYSDEIEAEANSYFHQLFEEQLPMDAVIQMLSRFSTSSDPRERAISDCMIHNLFDEYKFFQRYPERQLKITAVLFGSLIKHQLVSHLTLGVALRYVLDSLRKSVDSKMFLFGSKALEQFMDRLEEYPQYCNHILQISHLRATHSELVSYIERILARISLSQSESAAGNSVAPDQSQHNTSQDSTENMEPIVSSNVHSLHQLQQRPTNYLDDRQKISPTSVTHTKPLYPSVSSGSVPNGVDLVSSQKSTGSQPSQGVPLQTSSSGTASILTSTGLPRSSQGVLRQPLHSTGFGSALNIETLVAAAERRETLIEEPPSEVQDKVFFMINNISTSNVEAKAKEFIDILKEQYYPWFAQYMVMKRASIEPNFHDLYLKFLDKVNSRSLNKEIVMATYENCKVLLRSQLIKSSSEERSLLKNLGSWLGKFTIGRNQALRAREIDPKQLIIEAYERGLMIAVIPFTSKILEPCQSSLAYQPPNPWTMGILGLLAEIHALPNLKMNLKFDIEMLFKNLGVDMKDVKPTSLLKHRVREVEGNPDFSNKDPVLSQPQVADLSPGIISSLSQVDLQSDVMIPPHPSGHSNYVGSLHLTSGILGEDDKIGNLVLPERLPAAQGLSQVTSTQPLFSVNQLAMSIQNIGAHVVVNQKLNAIGQQLQLQRKVPLAMEKAIQEVITPVIERSITIACTTTKELVSKDYAMESDESCTHNAANLMVGSLAGSLAHVTCKEPLRLAISNQLRQCIQTSIVSSDILEQVIQIATNDNLDLGCALIEQVASDKAQLRIKNELADLLAMRRKQLEGLSAAFYEASMYSQGTLARLPEGLRPKPGRLSTAQQKVYQDFAPWPNQTTPGASALSAAQPASSGGFVGSRLPRPYASGSVQMNSSMYPTVQLARAFSSTVQSTDQIPEELESGLSLGHAGAVDGSIQSVDEISPVSTLSLPAAVTQVHATETSNSKILDPIPLLQQFPQSTAERLGTGISDPLTTSGALHKYEAVAQKLESLVMKNARDAEIQAVIAEVPEIIIRCVSKDEAAMAIAQKVFKSLYECSSNSLFVSSNIAILVAIRDVCKLVVKELTNWVIYSEEERKYNKDIIFGLIRSELLNLAEYNVYLAKLIDGGKNKPAMDFSIALVHSLVDQDLNVSSSEFQTLLDALGKLSMRVGFPESLQQLVEIARNSSITAAQSAGLGDGVDKARFVRDKKAQLLGRAVTGREGVHLVTSEPGATDSVAVRDQIAFIFAEWARVCETSVRDEAPYLSKLALWQQLGILKGDEISEVFFRVLTEFVVSSCLNSEVNSSMLVPLQGPQYVSNLSFTAVDMYAKLVYFLVKYYAAEQGPTKVMLFPKVLSATVRSIQKDAEEKKGSFNPRPYYRLFINWIFDFNSVDPVLDAINFQILTALANAFHALQPLKVPSFSFVWLELVSHRCFMPKLLMSNSPKGWPSIQKLLVNLFKYLEPYLRTAELGEPVHFLYRGTLRVLLVLLHDFPEFLCDYHFSFCDVIPPTCIQMRNVILSAFPRNMRLPDPFTPNLKVDLLPDISQPPRILSDVDSALKVKQMKSDLDEYQKTRQPSSTFLTELKQRLMLSQNEASLAGTRYNVPLINSLVLYVGMQQEIQQMQSKAAPQQLAVPTPRMTNSACMDIFQKLIVEFDTEGRYLFLNAIANQLRYPNNHTHFFSCVILFLFAEANQEIIQEQITRVLLERLIVNRPHPWGLLITFIELIKNPLYSFWSKPFRRCAPEIEKLFDSVGRSCGGPSVKPVEESLVSGPISDN